MRLGILGSPTGFYVRDLQRACQDLSVEHHLLNFAELTTAIGIPLDTTQMQQTLYVGDSKTDRLDAVLVRSMPLGSLEQVIFRMDCLHAWVSEGVAVVNSPRCLETAIDKWLTLQRLRQDNLPVPPTIVCQNRDQAMDAWHKLGRDVLVKPIFGGEGRGIIRLQDPDMAWRSLTTLQQLGHVLYLQQFLPNFGYDIRVLVIGQQIFSVRRWAAEGSYRSNISMGGRAVPYQLTGQQRELALRAAAAVDGRFVGVDLMPAQDNQTYVLEVNAVPGWKGLSACLSVDVAQAIVQQMKVWVQST